VKVLLRSQTHETAQVTVEVVQKRDVEMMENHSAQSRVVVVAVPWMTVFVVKAEKVRVNGEAADGLCL